LNSSISSFIKLTILAVPSEVVKMRLLYCDETNMQEKSGDFFVYAGLVIDSARALGLSKKIEKIRTDAKIDRAQE
jgi:hypothetical protein